MTLETWISTHSYLRPVAEFHLQIAEAAKNVPMTFARIPNWKDYAQDYRKGLPFLHSSFSTLDCAEVERIVSHLLGKLETMPIPQELNKQSLELCAEFRRDPAMLGGAIAALLGFRDFTFFHEGLFRRVGWMAVARYLGPLVTSFVAWRDEDSWMQHYCPICGSGPSMAQLAGADLGRRRNLVCGYCGMRWLFGRMDCPFCEDASHHSLSVLAVEGEKQFRIDYCDSCLGYLKTYNGEGSESILLADWTSLHLDVLARDRGLKRFADSLYDLGGIN
jgi:FdhE protein